MSKNTALILAGGHGTRARQDIPKQFIEINGKPLVCYTIEKFLAVSEIDEIIIVCLEDWIPKIKEYIDFTARSSIRVCAGGGTGLDSVWCGLQILRNNDGADLVLIHDGVRPFVDAETIRKNILTAQKYGCAVTSVDCVETLVYTEDGLYSERIVQRDYLKRVMTPQTFRLKTLRDLFSDHEKIISSKSPSTFCLYVEGGHC